MSRVLRRISHPFRPCFGPSLPPLTLSPQVASFTIYFCRVCLGPTRTSEAVDPPVLSSPAPPSGNVDGTQPDGSFCLPSLHILHLGGHFYQALVIRNIGGTLTGPSHASSTICYPRLLPSCLHSYSHAFCCCSLSLLSLRLSFLAHRFARGK